MVILYSDDNVIGGSGEPLNKGWPNTLGNPAQHSGLIPECCAGLPKVLGLPKG